MFGWIPLIGPIINGIFSMFRDPGRHKVEVHIADDVSHAYESRNAARIIDSTRDDILLKILRDATILPVVVWTMLIGWDSIISANWRDQAGFLHWYHPWAENWRFIVGDYPPSLNYLPYAVLVFLFGNIGINMWKNK